MIFIRFLGETGPMDEDEAHSEEEEDDDDDEYTDADSSIATCNSRLNSQRTPFNALETTSAPSPSKIGRSPVVKRNSIRRPAYNLALPPLVEHLYDEETGDDYV